MSRTQPAATMQDMADEIVALKAIAEKSFDYLFAETNPEFAARCGGMSALRAELVEALGQYEEATDIDCRSVP